MKNVFIRQQRMLYNWDVNRNVTHGTDSERVQFKLHEIYAHAYSQES